jgi:hypothetical protein
VKRKLDARRVARLEQGRRETFVEDISDAELEALVAGYTPAELASEAMRSLSDAELIRIVRGGSSK